MYQNLIFFFSKNNLKRWYLRPWLIFVHSTPRLWLTLIIAINVSFAVLLPETNWIMKSFSKVYFIEILEWMNAKKCLLFIVKRRRENSLKIFSRGQTTVSKRLNYWKIEITYTPSVLTNFALVHVFVPSSPWSPPSISPIWNHRENAVRRHVKRSFYCFLNKYFLISLYSSFPSFLLVIDRFYDKMQN